MNVTLHDSRITLPDDPRQHILVFSGFADKNPEDTEPRIVTEVHCTYRVGDQVVEFRKNSDANTQRFEEALSWAVNQAEIIGVSDIHAVFELNRAIEPGFLARICPNGIVDRRRRANRASKVGYLSVPAWPSGEFRKRSFSMSPLRRYYVFRNMRVSASERHAATTP